MSHQREHWFVSRLGTLSERYIASHVTLAFDEYLNVVRMHCPTERHLVEFLKSDTAIQEIAVTQPARFYPTWQEASEVVIKAGVTSCRDYERRWKQIDPRLPSNPNRHYHDFPDWYIFLGQEAPDLYPIWQEASTVAIAAGAKGRKEYQQRYREVDPRLPCNPNEKYPDFPGWLVFLGTSKYPTRQEASAVAIEAGVSNAREYKQRYNGIDPRLPSDPRKKYADFPGWPIFLGPRKTKLYPTWQEASKVAIAAGITTGPEYRERYKEVDSRLPGNPFDTYEDFPGWPIFFGRRKANFYPTCQEASAVAIAAGLTNRRQYREQHKEIDPRLPSNPDKNYRDFPGWPIFLGKQAF